MQTIKKNIANWFFSLALWFIVQRFGGYPPAEKEAFRTWLLANLQKNILPIVTMTEVTWDDDLLKIVQSVVENDLQFNIAWEMFRSNETITEETIVTKSLLRRIHDRITAKRMGVISAGVFSSEQEACSVALAALIISLVANGPIAVQNIKALVDRIKNRRNNE